MFYFNNYLTNTAEYTWKQLLFQFPYVATLYKTRFKLIVYIDIMNIRVVAINF